MDVKNKLAVITGSAQGLGRAFAETFLKSGAKVCLSDVNAEVGKSTMSELKERFGNDRVTFISCDVTKRENLVALYENCEEHFGAKIDIWCNNAGINANHGWRLCLEVNTMAVMEATEVVMERMSGRGGLIVNTASLAGIVSSTGNGGHASYPYFASKHAVVSLTRNLGCDAVFKETGIKVQCICPCFADTAIIDDKDGGKTFRKTLEDSIGILSVESVADAFMQLVENCGNGEALIVHPLGPPFVYHDPAYPLVIILATLSMVLGKMFGLKMLLLRHQLSAFAFFFFALLAMFKIILF